MPPRTRQADDTDTAETTSSNGYVVLTDMLTYTVKSVHRPGQLSAQRARRGSHVDLDPALNNVDKLIGLKAIAPDDGSHYKRTNAAVLARAIGGQEDKVATAAKNLFDVTGDDVTPVEASTDDDDDEDETQQTPSDGE